MAKYELKKSTSGKYHFNLKAGNGQVILSSGMFESADAARAAIAQVKIRGGNDGNFERKTSSAGEPYFVLTGTDGKMLGKSEMYTSTSGMENGIASVGKNAASAEIEDATGA